MTMPSSESAPWRSAWSALTPAIPAVKHANARARLELHANRPERDVEREHAGAVGLQQGERERAERDRGEQPAARPSFLGAGPADDGVPDEGDEDQERREDGEALAVQGGLRIRLQRGGDDEDGEDDGEEGQQPRGAREQASGASRPP